MSETNEANRREAVTRRNEFGEWSEVVDSAGCDVAHFVNPDTHEADARRFAASERMEAALQTVAANFGEAIHASLRKAGDSKEARAAWGAITLMDNGEWSRVVSYALDGLGVTEALADLEAE